MRASYCRLETKAKLKQGLSTNTGTWWQGGDPITLITHRSPRAAGDTGTNRGKQIYTHTQPHTSIELHTHAGRHIGKCESIDKQSCIAIQPWKNVYWYPLTHSVHYCPSNGGWSIGDFSHRFLRECFWAWLGLSKGVLVELRWDEQTRLLTMVDWDICQSNKCSKRCITLIQINIKGVMALGIATNRVEMCPLNIYFKW